MTASHAPETPTDDPPTDWSAQVEALAAKLRPVRDAAAIEREERERQRDLARAARVRAANTSAALDQIPLRYAEAIPTHPVVAGWVADVIGSRTRDGLILTGPTGTGKTWQAYGAFRAVVEARGWRSHAITVPALLDALRPGRPGSVDYTAVEQCDLLLLDDLAAERDTDWTAETLYRLIDARYSHLRPTIITANATGPMIRERLGDRVASRLNEMGRHAVLTGPDRRAVTGRVDTD